MPQIQYRGNLTTAFLPFLVNLQGQTVIVPKQDQNVTPRIPTLAGEDNSARDYGFPQVSYIHNVFPTQTGMKSIGFKKREEGINVDTFTDIFILIDPDDNRTLYSPAQGGNYTLEEPLGAWHSSSGITPTDTSLCTVAYLNGHTYIFFSEVGMFEYNNATQVLDPVVLTGITAGDMRGICASNGYLIAWDYFTVYRSQPTDPLNFTSDPSLGSGSSIPNDIKGRIVVCLPISDGFIIYCLRNAVAASFQNNIQYPFQYKEVKGSSGITHPSKVSWSANLGSHYAWTIDGFQQVNKLNATLIFPEVTDFLTSHQYESYDVGTNTLNITQLTDNFLVRVAVVGNRYVILSYGVVEFTDALVLDLSYRRWGKVHLLHTAAFEFIEGINYAGYSWSDFGAQTWADQGILTWADFTVSKIPIDPTNDTFAFLQKDGTVWILVLNTSAEGAEGVMLLGKYQFMRDRWLNLDGVSIQNGTPNDSTKFKMYDLPSYDGMNFEEAVPLFMDPDNKLDRTLVNTFADIEAKNHTISIQGDFGIADINLTFHLSSHM